MAGDARDLGGSLLELAPQPGIAVGQEDALQHVRAAVWPRAARRYALDTHEVTDAREGELARGGAGLRLASAFARRLAQ